MSDLGFGTLLIAAFIATVGVLVILAAFIDGTVCANRWPDRNPSYGILQGCMIDTPDGRIPAENYRVM